MKVPQAVDRSQAVDSFSNASVTAELQSNNDPFSLVHPQVRFHALSPVSRMNGSPGH